MSGPRAEGVRVHWHDLPLEIRRMLEQKLGAEVAEATTQPSGFSPGMAARLRLTDGRRVFLKAVYEGANPDSPNIHRREARVLARMPIAAPVPRLLWFHDADGWVALCLEDIAGRHPHEPWTEPDLSMVVATLKETAALLTPSPFATEETAARKFVRSINGWQVARRRGEDRLDAWCLGNLSRLAELEAEAPQVVEGDTLLHFDVRADNLLIAGDRVYVVDWPWACIGPAWIDWAFMAPSVAMQGGPEPESFLSRFDLSQVSRRALDAAICTLSGYLVVNALEPPPPGLPTLRAFQAAQGRVAVKWLRERLGWD
jgi:aminoglycoside phosphotransferase (APT) family kinase protein